MNSGKNAYLEMPSTQSVFHYEKLQLAHQPVIVCMDVSSSMDHTEGSQSKSNIALAEDMVNQVGQDPKMSKEYKDTADICINTFAQDVITVQDWIPLSHYNGGLTLHAMGTTAFHDALRQSINAARVMKASYSKNGIYCKRPQVFIITDGYSTDPRDNPEAVEKAKELCEKYVDTNKIAVHVILLPGGSTADARALSTNIKLYKVDDCTYGLPAVKDFINASIVSFSSSSLGSKATIVLPAPIKTTQSVNRQADGSRTVTQSVEKWN